MRRTLLLTGIAVCALCSAAGASAAAPKMYWSANFGEGGALGLINRADLTGANPETAYKSLGAVVTALALDESSGALYWAQGTSGEIWSGDALGCAPLFPAGGDVEDLAVDAAAAKLYRLQGGGANGVILRSNLDGSGVETVVTGVVAGLGIDVDPLPGTVYWTEAFGIESKIRRADYDGGNVQTVVALAEQVWDVAVDPIGGKIYWADRDFVRRADLDGGNQQAIVATVQAQIGVLAIAVDPGLGKVYWSEVGTGSAFQVPARIRRANLDGSNPQSILVENGAGVAAAAALVLDASGSLDWGCGTEPLPIAVPASSVWTAGGLALLLLGLAALLLRSR